MELKRRGTLIYSLLLGVWVLVVAWQIEEHSRVQEAAKNDLRSRSTEIRQHLERRHTRLAFSRHAVLQDRLEPVLNELVNGRTNELVNSSGLISIALLNTDGEPIAAAGDTNLMPNLSEGEYWAQRQRDVCESHRGASVESEGATNPTVVLPAPPPDFTNGLRGGFPRREPPPGETNATNIADLTIPTRPAPTPSPKMRPAAPPPPDFQNRPRGGGRGRPPWLRGMSDADYTALIARRELHGLVLTMSTENFQAICTRDLWMRCIIAFFAGISALVAGLAWRNTSKTSELQLRLVRASELNSHLKEMNLAAAGLAHETRNPLNIIRGMAQMLSKESGAPPEIRDKARAIVDETDKVTVQLNEFINYSRPREVRRAKLALNSAVGEVDARLEPRH